MISSEYKIRIKFLKSLLKEEEINYETFESMKEDFISLKSILENYRILLKKESLNSEKQIEIERVNICIERLK